MRKIIAITQLTLDGVMQAPGGPDEDPRSGFAHGGWAMPFIDEAVGRALDATVAGDFDLLLGRRTYDIFAGYWPQHGDMLVGQQFNRAKKYVVTRRRDRLDWPTSQRLAVEDVGALKSADGPPLHIWGSGELLQALMAAGIVDEHRLWIVPLVLGTGRRLFEPGLPPHGLTLVDSQSTTKGVLLNTYRPKRV